VTSVKFALELAVVVMLDPLSRGADESPLSPISVRTFRPPKCWSGTLHGRSPSMGWTLD
jgi:hypothetical protein